jgi:hypothetical protein
MPPLIITRGSASAKAFGFTNASLGSSNFITKICGCSYISVSALTTDASGNIYVAGSCIANLLKFCKAGKTLLLSKNLRYGPYCGGAGHPVYSSSINKILVDNSGSIYVNSTINNAQQIFKVNSTFTSIAAQKKFYSCCVGRIWDLSLDRCCNVIGVGHTFCCIPVIYKFTANTNLTVSYAKRGPASGACGYLAVATDACKSIYATWQACYNGRETIVKHKPCGCLCTSLGTRFWKKTSSSSTTFPPFLRALAVNSSKQLLATGTSGSGSGNFVFATQFNAALTGSNWVRSIVSQCPTKCAQVCSPSSVTYDACGNSYVGGFACRCGNRNGFVVKFTSCGTVCWQRQFGISGSSLYVTGIKTSGTNYLATIKTNCRRLSFLVNLPKDGSKTGSLVVGCTTVCYVTGNMTINTTASFSTTSCTPSISSFNNPTCASCGGLYSVSPTITNKTL